MRRFEARLPLAAGTLVAIVATTGSLFLSLGLGLVPCELCWYQRILMYPLVIVLGVAAVENRRRVFLTALPAVDPRDRRRRLPLVAPGQRHHRNLLGRWRV